MRSHFILIAGNALFDTGNYNKIAVNGLSSSQSLSAEHSNLSKAFVSDKGFPTARLGSDTSHAKNRILALQTMDSLGV